jgi:NADPH-dependent 2,4-dienoyl-CoA reductase/sulfur reductase-like enzyme
MSKMGDLRRGIDAAVPVIGIGRVTSLAMAESFIEQGACDIVAMTRAHISDPDVIKKTMEGEGHRIRPCVGALECSNRKAAGGDATCFQNPEVLREAEFAVVKASPAKRVAVVGAGPAGLKAAETLLRRGHEVTVFDDNTEPGGLLRYVRATEARGLFGAAEWLIGELRDGGVKLELGSRLDGRGLASFAPDEVVVATGGRPYLDEVFMGADLGHVISSAAALDEEVDHDVVVYDGMGVMEAALVAEALARQGKSVAFVTRFDALLPNAGFNHQVETSEILHKVCSKVIVGGVIGLLDGRTAHVVTPFGTAIDELNAGTVVAVTPLRPDLSLVPDIEALGVPYYVAGNARAHRLAIHAFREGAEVGMRP